MWTDRERTKFSKILLDFIFLLWFYWTKIVDEKKRVENKTKHALSVFSLFRIRHIYHIFLSILQSQHFSMCHILLLHTTEHTHTHTHNYIGMVATASRVYWISCTHSHCLCYPLKWNLLSLWFILPGCNFIYEIFLRSSSLSLSLLLSFHRFLRHISLFLSLLSVSI